MSAIRDALDERTLEALCAVACFVAAALLVWGILDDNTAMLLIGMAVALVATSLGVGANRREGGADRG